ncbi:MAG: endopeptidase La [Hyphomonadaceae bacterium]
MSDANRPAGNQPSTDDLKDLLVVPVRGLVLFPGAVMPLTIGRPRSIAAAQQAVREGRQIGILLQKDPEAPDPLAAELHSIGVIANVLRFVTGPDGAHHLICQGEQRFRVTEFVKEQPFFACRFERLSDTNTATPEVEARFINLKNQAVEVLKLLPQSPPELLEEVETSRSPAALVDLVAAYIDATAEEKQAVLETLDLNARLERVGALLSHRLQVLRLSHEIGEKTKSALDERQREIFLREQMAAIQKQLGDADGRQQEAANLAEKIANAQMPPDVEEAARKELRRLERTPEAATEHGMIRTYLDWLVDLPWSLPDSASIDIAAARRVLEEDHFGLEKIKQRIIEFLAVRKLAPGGKAPILCFVGPPGVGKTSLGQSIARAMQRKFVRVSLGGVHDEAEIRGHRRTYVGSMPGNIIQAIRKVGARDCVMMLDEIDKMGAGVQGDPAAAMLEVLDPEQNATFRDNYLGVPFDLSKIVFIATANMLDTVSGPLRDRMEIIQLAGYTDQEKLEIARRYLVPRQLEANGLKAEQALVEDDALRAIIRGYTHEAGVRNLEREIGKALRHVAVAVVEKGAMTARITPANLGEQLGEPRFEDEIAMRTSIPGVVTGLAWTPAGGDILFIEAARMPGKGGLTLTGQLGDVMRESAQAALSLVKSSAGQLQLDPSIFEKSDIHVHVPAGATPKDGPSAGVAMYMALVSLLSGRSVRSDTAMTGEISLRGLVLPVGGIKEKVVAAARSGITRVLLPARNRRDVSDIPEDVRNRIEIVWIERVDQAIAAAFVKSDLPAAIGSAA